LRDAGNYIAKLPKREHDAPAWRAAIEALMLVVEHGGYTNAAEDRDHAGAVRRRRARSGRRNIGSSGKGWRLGRASVSHHEQFAVRPEQY
jgi:hypothetical protein